MVVTWGDGRIRASSGLAGWGFRRSVFALLSLVTVLSLVPLILLHAVGAGREFEDRVKARAGSDVKRTVARLDAHVGTLRAWAAHVAEDFPGLHAALERDRAADGRASSIPSVTAGLQAISRRQGFGGIAVFRKDGRVAARAGDIARPDLLGTWSFFRRAASGDQLVSEMYSDQGGTRFFIAAYAPVRRNPDGPVIGVVAIEEGMGALARILHADFGAIASGSFGMLSGEHLVRMHNDFNPSLNGRPLPPLPPDVRQEMLRERRFGALTARKVEPTHDEGARQRNADLFKRPSEPIVSRRYINAVGSHGLVVQMWLRNAPWVYWLAVPEATFREPIKAQLRHDALILLGVLALAGGLSALAARRLARPVEALRTAVRDWEEGKLFTRAPALKPKEFGDLAASFNRMAERLQRNTESLEDLVQERTSALTAANSQLLEAYDRLREADRYKDEFLAVISHELRTPLNFITGFASILDDEVAGPITPDQRAYLRHILNGADRMLELVEDLLDISRMAAGKFDLAPETVDVAPIIEEALATMRPLADEKRVTLSGRDQFEGTAVLDRRRVVQVLTNLLSNGVKFTPAGGQVRVSSFAQGEALVVEVTDTGIGIAAEDLPKLFKRFGQLDMSSTRQVGGAGLGLSICKAIVEAHGGSIGVESATGRGSTFRIALPLAAARDAPGLAGAAR